MNDTYNNKDRKIYIVTLVVTVVALAFSFFIWLFVDNLNNNTIYEKIELENKRITNSIKTDLDIRMKTFHRMVQRWQLGQTNNLDVFSAEARSYMVDMPGLIAFEYIDTSYNLRWTIDIETITEKEVDFSLKNLKYKLLLRVKNTKVPYICNQSGDKNEIYIFFPLEINNQFAGFLSAVIDMNIWLKSLISLNYWEDISLNIYLNDRMIFEDSRFSTLEENLFYMTSTFPVNNELITINYKRTAEYLEKNNNFFPNIIGISAFLLSILISFCLFLYLKENNKVWENKIIHTELEEEIKHKQEIEKALRETSTRLMLATETGRVGIWNWNLENNNLLWNEAMYSLYELPKSTAPSFEVWRETLEKKDLDEAQKSINEIIKTHGRFDRVFKITTLNRKKKYIHAIAQVITDDNNQASEVVGINWDITPIKNIEAKLRAESELQQILIDISNNYINLPLENIQKHIDNAMGTLGSYVNADRVYIFQYDFEKNTTSNTYEWVANGISAHIDDLQDLKIEGVLWDWVETHKKGQYMLIPKTKELPNSSLKELLLQQDIKTLLTVPMINDNKLLGFIGFDWVKDYHNVFDKETTLLNLFSQIMVSIITRTEKERKLVESETRLALALNGTQAGLWDWYIDSGKVTFNERWAEMVGYTLDELEPSIDTWIKLCHPDDLKESNRLLEEHFSGKSSSYEYEARMKHKDGHWIWVFDSGQVVEWGKDRRPIRMTGTHFDITERRAAEEQIKHMATHDYLTDLPTMHLALDRAKVANEQAIRNDKSTAFIFLDLDGFKSINDNYGHDIGDELLKEVAIRMKETIRSSDTAARIGGDEFLVILSQIAKKEEVIPIAKSLLEVIKEPILVGEIMVQVGVSIGIAVFPEDGNSIQDLIKKADIAMYTIKKTTKNNFTFISDIPKP